MNLRDRVFKTAIEYHNRQYTSEAESARRQLLDAVFLYLNMRGKVPPELLALKAIKDEIARNIK